MCVYCDRIYGCINCVLNCFVFYKRGGVEMKWFIVRNKRVLSLKVWIEFMFLLIVTSMKVSLSRKDNKRLMLLLKYFRFSFENIIWESDILYKKLFELKNKFKNQHEK